MERRERNKEKKNDVPPLSIDDSHTPTKKSVVVSLRRSAQLRIFYPSPFVSKPPIIISTDRVFKL